MPMYPQSVANQGAHPNSLSFRSFHIWTHSWVYQGAWGCVNMDQNVYLEVVPMHVLYLIICHQCIIIWKIHTRNDCVLKHIDKWILELDVLPPRYEVMKHKIFQARFQVLKKLTWLCIMVFHSRSFHVPAIFIMPNYFITYVLPMDGFINLWFKWP
jgi:hypothetical protein